MWLQPSPKYGQNLQFLIKVIASRKIGTSNRKPSAWLVGLGVAMNEEESNAARGGEGETGSESYDLNPKP